jgi:hypothetical protein
MAYKKSQRSNSFSNCVEVDLELAEGQVGVRDTKDREGPALAFSHDAWASFIAAVKGGQIRSALP